MHASAEVRRCTGDDIGATCIFLAFPCERETRRENGTHLNLVAAERDYRLGSDEQEEGSNGIVTRK